VTYDPRARGSESLLAAASNRVDEALSAWIEDDFDRAAASAPMAVELLCKALLWQTNPTLLVPLEPNQEAALVTLATEPSLDSPTLRTIGLRAALGRLTRVLGDLPVPGKRQNRLIDCRNGSLHVGTLPRSGEHGAEVTARHVLADSLILCDFVLAHLGQERAAFYGEKVTLARGLLEKRRTEVEHKVTRRMAQASDRLEKWRAHVDDDAIWEQAAESLADAAEETFAPQDFGLEMGGIDHDCPVCGYRGRLLGRVDVDGDADVEYEDGEPVYYGYWIITFYPRAFACNVCKLTLHGTDELAAGGLSSREREVGEADLGNDFSASEWAEQLYGLGD
jgi:hypothetical protein